MRAQDLPVAYLKKELVMKDGIKAKLVCIRNAFISAADWTKGRIDFSTIRKNPLSVALISGFLVLFLISATATPKGKIIPLGKEMIAAFELLKSTQTGRELIKEVEKSTKGNIVYMMMGATESHDLTYYGGETVRGVTRTYFKSFSNLYTTSGILVYTNRDLTWGQPTEIVKNIAFELENVIYSMKFPGTEFGQDSPQALVTQKQVCMELGL